MRNYRAIITSPLGQSLDITALTDLSDLGSVSMELEDDLAAMTHSDFALALDNSGGIFEAFVSNAAPTDVYEFAMERSNPDGSWSRVFGGILDLLSVAYNDKEKSVSVQAFSYSKLLERMAADGIKRIIAPKTATISAASKSMTINSGGTSDINVGDKLKLDAGSGTDETFIVDKIVSSTAVATTKAAANAFSVASAFVETAYLRDKTPAYLLGQIATAAGVAVSPDNTSASPAITTEAKQRIASFPVGTPLSLTGLSLVRTPRSLIPTAAKVRVTFSSTDETKRKELSTPSGTWADGSTSNTPEGDWRPYLTSEPGSILASTNGGNFDNGSMAWDHTGSHVYHLQDDYNAGGDTYNLKLYKDGVFVGSVIHTSSVAGGPHDFFALDYDPINDQVWVSYQHILDGAKGLVVRTNAGVAVATVESSKYGDLRTVRSASAMAFYDRDAKVVRFYDVTSLATLRELAAATGIARAYLWTARAWDSWFAYVFSDAAGTKIRIYETSGWTHVQTYAVSPQQSTQTFMTIASFDGVNNLGVGYGGGEWFVLSLKYDGVVRYADFHGKSCAAAAKDLAIVTNSLVSVDRFKVLSLLARADIDTGDAVADLGSLLESTRKPFSDVYRASVKVTGTDSNGDDLLVIAGSEGDSASRLDVSSDLITTGGMAAATAASTLDFVSSVRDEIAASALDLDSLLTPFDKVTVNGRKMVVYAASTDLGDGTQTIRLLGTAA